MVTSVYLKPSLVAPSCTLFQLYLREWDGYDKPDHTKIATLHMHEAAALIEARYVPMIDQLRGIGSCGVNASDILFIKEEHRGSYVVKNLHVILPKRPNVRDKDVDWIDPRSRFDLRLDHPKWLPCHDGYYEDDSMMLEVKPEPWPDNPAEAVPFW